MNPLPQRRSLVSETANVLREQIAAGTWSDSLPGERELSNRLRVSRPTLRAALELLRREGRLEVSQGQRRRVRQKPTTGKSVNPSPGTAVVLLTPLPTHRMPPFVMFWVDELRQHLADEGFELNIHITTIPNLSQPEPQLERLQKEMPAAAWVLFRSNERMQRWFAKNDLPCVVTGSCFPGVDLPSVDIDSHAVCRHAAGLFVSKGHKHIALLLPETCTAGDQASEAGFLEGAGIHPTIRATVMRHNGTIESICQKTDHLVRGKSPATGLLVARSAHALTVFTHVLQQGLKMPHGLALISRDNDAFLDLVVPRLARYACDPVTFARRVSRLVLKSTKEGSVSHRQVLLMPELIKGDTFC